LLLYVIALLVALLIGGLLPHPLALGAVWRLGDRVTRLENIVRDRLGVALDEHPHRDSDAYTAETARIRARMNQYLRQAEEEKQ